MALHTTFDNLLTGESTAEFNKLSVMSGGSMQDILTLISAGGRGQLASSVTPMVLQLNGTTQAATAFNFVENNAVLSSSLVNISRMAWQDALTLRYSASGTDKDLTQGPAGQLLWNSQEIQLKQNAFQQINVVAPLTTSGSNAITIETLWKPSTITVGAGITVTANDATGTCALGLDGTENRTSLKIIDSGSTVSYLQASLAGGLIWNSAQLATLNDLNAYSTTTALNALLNLKANDAAVITAFAGVAAQLSQKQDTLTAGPGAFLNASTISGYDLKLNTNSTPTAVFKCLRFEELSVTEPLSLGSGQVELKVSLGLKPVSRIVGLQDELNKIVGLRTGASRISFGEAGADRRIAIHEVLSSGHYFSGAGFYQGSTTGMACWGGSGAALPDQGSGSGTSPHLFIQSSSRVGIGNVAPAYKLDVTGDIRATGTVYGAVKSFDIQHPDPEKPDMRLRHWCVETADCPGGLVMYRRTIDMTSTTETIQMPDWFSHLTKDVMVQVTPYQRFGSAWGECTGNTIELHATTLGKWHVLITASKNDFCCATTMCPQEVEYIPDPPENGEAPFPP